MQFAPPIDPRLAARVRRIPDVGCSASVWRALRRRAQALHAATPCYESVRLLVLRERERRARIVASIATMLELSRRRVQTVPADVGWVYERNLRRSRLSLHARATPPP